MQDNQGLAYPVILIPSGGHSRLICIGLGLDIEHIMRLGGWESLDLVVRYTRSVKFEESLRVMRGMG